MSASSSEKGLGLSMVLFGVAIVVIVVIKTAVGALTSPPPADMSDAAVAERIAPVGQMNTGEPIAAAAPAPAASGSTAPRSGEEIYNTVCMACHANGVAGAPKFGDAEQWAPRIAKGIDGLMHSALNGLNAMPARGTCANCSDDELKAAIEFMVSKSGGESAAAPAAAEAPAAAPAPAAEPAPVAAVEAPAAEAAAGRSGDAIYHAACFVCHATGAAGAPLFGNAEQWAPRIAKGMDGLMHSALNGLNAMPPRGTCADCTDAELQGAIQYMVDNSK